MTDSSTANISPKLLKLTLGKFRMADSNPRNIIVRRFPLLTCKDQVEFLSNLMFYDRR
jgi:hypothetical protein